VSPQLGEHVLRLLDALDEPVSVGVAVRDRDQRILDFRLEFVNLAAARWAGVPRESMIGLITGELFSGIRASGFFEKLRSVVETGEPFFQSGALIDDQVIGGQPVSGVYDLRAIRLGDGYLSTWRRADLTPA
jgi:PAS domain-containing protein